MDIDVNAFDLTVPRSNAEYAAYIEQTLSEIKRI